MKFCSLSFNSHTNLHISLYINLYINLHINFHINFSSAEINLAEINRAEINRIYFLRSGCFQPDGPVERPKIPSRDIKFELICI